MGFMIELNKIHHLDNREGLALLPEKCASLIIADPPYFEVKGDFDFVWSSFDEYLSFMEEQAKLYKRVLAENGTLFVYGHAKRIAYVQVIFDRYFNLENNITVHIFDRQTNKGVESFRCFAPVTERLLMYSNEIMRTGLEEIKLDMDNFTTLRGYFKQVQDFIGTGKNSIIDKLGQKADHCFRHGSTQWDMPTPETYAGLILHFGIDKMQGFIEYEALRLEYEALRRPFNNLSKLTDVMRFSQEGHITKDYDHDTVKPEKLSKTLILTCSRPDDLVVVPFSGSGTECAMAAKEGRQFVGFETTLKHVEMSNNRVHEATRQGALFSC